MDGECDNATYIFLFLFSSYERDTARDEAPQNAK
jgi:hypothetical protein